MAVSLRLRIERTVDGERRSEELRRSRLGG
jgi:hypothetical protein